MVLIPGVMGKLISGRQSFYSKGFLHLLKAGYRNSKGTLMMILKIKARGNQEALNLLRNSII